MSTTPTPPPPPVPHIYASASRATKSPDGAHVAYDNTLHFLDGSQAPMPTITVPFDVAEDVRKEAPAFLSQMGSEITANNGQMTHAQVARVVGYVQALLTSPSAPAAPTAPTTWNAPDLVVPTT